MDAIGEISPENVNQLLDLAEKFAIEPLARLCRSYLRWVLDDISILCLQPFRTFCSWKE
jgi:hypothetical protein